MTTILIGLVLPLYIALASVYSRLQRQYAERGRAGRPGPSEPYLPDVDVVVPCFNEDPELLAACLRSIREQDYAGKVRVWLVDDGSDNRDALLPTMRPYARPGWSMVFLDRNRGKREAQAVALRDGRGEIVVTLDSDTTISPEGMRRLVAPLHDPRVGAVTGNLRASNASATWLTRLVDTRYQLLFGRERAAQGFFATGFCCAGPFSAYRRTVVERVLAEYLAQQFWGHRRVFGDDLALTSLVIASGYLTEWRRPTVCRGTSPPCASWRWPALASRPH